MTWAKRIGISIAAGALFAGGVTIAGGRPVNPCPGNSCHTTTTTPSPVLFDDEFSTAGTPDSAKWWATPWCSTSSDDQAGCYDVDNAFVTGGNLVLRVSKGTNGRPYDFGRVQTFREGGWPPPAVLWSHAPPIKVEARIKFAPGAGVWGALWPMGTNATNPIELDVQEFRGFVPQEVTCHVHNVAEYAATVKSGIDLSQAFHVYTLDYYSDHVVFSFDGRLCGSFSVGSTQMIGIRLANQVGVTGSWGGIGGPPPTSAIPADMLVDWVRVTN